MLYADFTHFHATEASTEKTFLNKFGWYCFRDVWDMSIQSIRGPGNAHFLNIF